MSDMATKLLRFADDLESRRWRQIRSKFDDDTGGRWLIAVWSEQFGGFTHAAYDDACEWAPAFVEVVCRTLAIPPFLPVWGPLHQVTMLNDDYGVTYAEAAQAARIVARQLQEAEYGEPIEAVVERGCEAELAEVR